MDCPSLVGVFLYQDFHYDVDLDESMFIRHIIHGI